MPQKQKLSIGLMVIAVLLISAVVAYFWSIGKINIGASTGESPIFSPEKLNLTVGQIYPIEVSGGTLPYGGYASDDPDIAEVESWYSNSVASGTTDPALTLVVKGIKAGSANIQIWDKVGTIKNLPVVITPVPSDVNSTVKFTETSLKVNLTEQCDATLETSESTNNFWTTGFVSDPMVAIPSGFGGVTTSGGVKPAFRFYGAKIGTSSVLVKNADDNYAKLDIEVVQSGGTCPKVTEDIGNPQTGADITFLPKTPPQLLIGQLLAVRATAPGKAGGFIIDKPNVLSADSWNSVDTNETIHYLTLRGVSAGTANLYYWDQNGKISRYTITVTTADQVNINVSGKAAFNPVSTSVKVGEESDLVVDLGDQSSQWVSVVSGDSAIAVPARFGAVQQGDQLKLALRVKGVGGGETSFILVHKDGNLAKVDVSVAANSH